MWRFSRPRLGENRTQLGCVGWHENKRMTSIEIQLRIWRGIVSEMKFLNCAKCLQGNVRRRNMAAPTGKTTKQPTPLVHFSPFGLLFPCRIHLAPCSKPSQPACGAQSFPVPESSSVTRAVSVSPAVSRTSKNRDFRLDSLQTKLDHGWPESITKRGKEFLKLVMSENSHEHCSSPVTLTSIAPRK